MMYGRLAKTATDINEVCKAMPVYGNKNVICMFGYWDENKCVGGAYLCLEYPNKLVMEFYSKKFSIVYAIADSFRYFLTLKNNLLAEIDSINFKSIKMVESLGFKKIRKENNIIHYQFNKSNWKFEKKIPLYLNKI